MSSELITSWGEHDASLKKILALASNSLCVFDGDLSKLKLGRSDSVELLRQFLNSTIDGKTVYASSCRTRKHFAGTIRD